MSRTVTAPSDSPLLETPLVAEHRAEAARFAGTRPPKVLGVMRPFLPMDSALMRAMFRMNGDLMSPQAKDGVLNGSPGARRAGAGGAVGSSATLMRERPSGSAGPATVRAP